MIKKLSKYAVIGCSVFSFTAFASLVAKQSKGEWPQSEEEMESLEENTEETEENSEEREEKSERNPDLTGDMDYKGGEAWTSAGM